MKADMRKLAAQLREDYPDWPADADGGKAGAFWRAVYALADRWTYFLPFFEERILTTFGRVKGTKKQLAPRLLYSVGERTRVLRPLTPGEPEPPAPEDLATLFAAGDQGRRAAGHHLPPDEDRRRHGDARGVRGRDARTQASGDTQYQPDRQGTELVHPWVMERG